jgi:glycosyltransferase involved in cell wall biosynthesis
MRILFLSHYFPPEVNAPASRTFDHCRQWVADGHEVTVITCVPNHPHGKVFPGYRNALFQREEQSGIRVVRIWTYVTANEGFLKRTMNFIVYMLGTVVMAPFVTKCDVVISTSPQFFNGLAGYFVSRIKRAPWVLEIRDLWPKQILVVGAIKNRFLIGILEWLERFAYRKADKIVPVTESFKHYMVNLGVDAGKIQVITNGVDLRFYDPIPKDSDIANEHGLAGKFVVSYLGTFGMSQNLETVMHAARHLQNKADIVFFLAGDGAEREKLADLRDRLALNNVVIAGLQPKHKMPGLWSVSDVSLILLKRSELFKTVIPSKIFESMAMERPVLLGVEGESCNIVRAAQCGFCIEPDNHLQLAEHVLLLYNDRQLCTEMGKNGRRYVADHYDRTVLAKCMVAVAKSLF